MSYTSGGIVWTNNPAFSLLNDGAAFPKELIQAPKYGEIATNLIFAGAFVAERARARECRAKRSQTAQPRSFVCSLSVRTRSAMLWRN